MSLIHAENLCKDYRLGDITIPALKNLTFSLDAGQLISFIGPSGSGKTTLLNLIGCLDTQTSGKLICADTEVVKLTPRQRSIFRGNNISFIFQEFNLIPVLTVYENVEYPLVMVRDVPPKERRERVLNLLEAVGILDQKDKYPHQVSGGQKQRTAVARALVSTPKIVLADEPTANLDHKTAYAIISLMKKMKEESGTTFVFSTHDPKVVQEAEIIHYLEDGELVDTKDHLATSGRMRKETDND